MISINQLVIEAPTTHGMVAWSRCVPRTCTRTCRLFDAQPSGRALLGAALAVASIGSYAWLGLRAPRPSGGADAGAASSDGESTEEMPLRGHADLQLQPARVARTLEAAVGE